MDWVLRRSYSWESLDMSLYGIKDRSFSYNEADTAQITSDLQVTLGHLLTVGNDNVASLLSCGGSVSIARCTRIRDG